MGGMTFEATPLQGLLTVRTAPHTDARGRFDRVYCEREFSCVREGLVFVQVNLSRTRLRGSIRGMHFQKPPGADAKLVRCTRGRVLDVAVDVRPDSPTYLSWHAVELDESNALEVFIPEGFAHGFQALSDDAELLYLHTAFWDPTLEAGLRYDDPRLRITWPLAPTVVSGRDRAHPLIGDQGNSA